VPEVRSTRIASGEHEATRFGFQELIRNRAAHILQPDITWSGGLTECLRIAAVAGAAGLPLIPHRGGSVYGMTLLCTLRGPTLAESFGTGDTGNQIMELLDAAARKGLLPAARGPASASVFQMPSCGITPPGSSENRPRGSRLITGHRSALEPRLLCRATGPAEEPVSASPPPRNPI